MKERPGNKGRASHTWGAEARQTGVERLPDLKSSANNKEIFLTSLNFGEENMRKIR